MKSLILHAVDSKISDYWYPWLKTELEKKGYEVFLPTLPGGWEPVYSEWKKIAVSSTEIDEDTIIIGHSLGAVLGLRFAEEIKFKKLILVGGWDFNSLTPYEQAFWTKMTDHSKIKQNVEQRVVVTSDNDPYFTATLAKEMSGRLEASFELVLGAGHFTDRKELPEVLKYIE